MKNYLLPISLLATLGTSPALAQNPATDWSGFYVGGTVGYDGANVLSIFITDTYDSSVLLSGEATYGGFVGYNLQKDDFVIGGEIAVSSGGVHDSITPFRRYQTMVDVKARFGYAMGDALPYVVIGRALSNYRSAEDYQSSGFSFGAGFDYQINEHLFFGAEYLQREMSGINALDPTIKAQATIHATQLRVGWKF